MEINEYTINLFKEFPAIINIWEYLKTPFTLDEFSMEYIHDILSPNPDDIIPKIEFWDKYLMKKEKFYNLIMISYFSKNLYKRQIKSYDFNPLYEYLNYHYPQLNPYNLNFYLNYNNYINYKEEFIHIIKTDIPLFYKYIKKLNYVVVIHNDIETYNELKLKPPKININIIFKNDCHNFIKIYELDEEFCFLESVKNNSIKILNIVKDTWINLDTAYILYKHNYDYNFKIYLSYFDFELLKDNKFFDYLISFAIFENNLNILNYLFTIMLDLYINNSPTIQNNFYIGIKYLLTNYNFELDNMFKINKFEIVQNSYKIAKFLHKHNIINFNKLPVYSINTQFNFVNNVFKLKLYDKIIDRFNLMLYPKCYYYIKQETQFDYLINKGIEFPKNLNKLLKNIIYTDVNFVERILNIKKFTKLPPIDLSIIKSDILVLLVKYFKVPIKYLVKSNCDYYVYFFDYNQLKEIILKLSNIYNTSSIYGVFKEIYNKLINLNVLINDSTINNLLKE
jgi:hypothetical protein